MSHPLLTSAFLASALAITPLAAQANAATDALAAPLITRLAKDGYALVETHLSWLGRLVVVTRKDGITREIVLNRTTGAILSDRTFRAATSAAPNAAVPDATAPNSASAPTSTPTNAPSTSPTAPSSAPTTAPPRTGGASKSNAGN